MSSTKSKSHNWCLKLHGGELIPHELNTQLYLKVYANAAEAAKAASLFGQSANAANLFDQLSTARDYGYFRVIQHSESQDRPTHPNWSRPKKTTVRRDRRRPESCLQRVQRLEKLGQIDSALDLLYDTADKMMRQHDLVGLRSLLSVQAGECSEDVLLGLLTATLPAKELLPERARLLSDAKTILTNRGQMSSDLLVGLE